MSKKNIPVFDETGVHIGMASENAEAEMVFGEPSFRTSLPRKHDYPVERVVLSGFDFSQQGHWHNLTEAITAGEPIDFEKLDGRKVRLTKSQAVLEDVLERDWENPADSFDGWYCSVFGYFTQAWRGAHDWTLWLDGEIPMRKQTADELEPGTVFDGIWFASENFSDVIKRAVVIRTGVNKRGIMAPPSPGHTKPEEWEVVSVVGDFESLGMYGQKESE